MHAIRRVCERKATIVAELAEYVAAIATIDSARYTPAFVDEMQTGIRMQLLACQSTLETLRKRQKGRSRRLRRRLERGSHLRAIATDHYSCVKRRVELIERERLLLRQAADAFVWNVFGHRSSLLFPLYAPQSHELARGIGAIGQTDLCRRLNGSGRVIAIENDLTRVLGVGDITVLPVDGDRSHPVVLEVKTHGEPVVGATVRLDIITAVADGGPSRELFNDVRTILDLRDDELPLRPGREERQAREILAVARVLAETEGLGSIDAAPRRRAWRFLSRLIGRATSDGRSFDIAENGIGYLATVADPLPPDHKEWMSEALEAMGITGPSLLLSSEAIQHDTFAAPLVPPIPLWEIPVPLKAKLLIGKLQLICAMDREVWARALVDQGLRLERNEEMWTIGRENGDTAITFSRADISRLILGTIFGGASPREFALNVSTALG